MNYEQQDDYILLHPDPHCCGWEGDCEGCMSFSHHKNACQYNRKRD